QGPVLDLVLQQIRWVQMVSSEPVHIARNTIRERDFRTVVQNLGCTTGVRMQGNHVARPRGSILNGKIIAPTGGHDSFRHFADCDHTPVSYIYTTTDEVVARGGERKTARNVGDVREIAPVRSVTKNDGRKSVQNLDEEARYDFGKLPSLMSAGPVSVEWSYYNARQAIRFEVRLRV